VFGVDLYLHWSWFFVALIEIANRRGSYHSLTFNVLEYVALFAIVLIHEMGHALACRSVGGRADEIVLWPLGGVAYVAPPQRPGAVLWSIAAGPLVNVVLFFVFSCILVAGGALGDGSGMVNAPDWLRFAEMLWWINLLLLAFNLFPVYPLDGGQIVRALLWFAVGRARSLYVTTIIGFIGVPVIFLLAWWQRSFWTALIGVFILMNCWSGLQHARMLVRVSKLPRREGLRCPSCDTHPPIGAWWRCERCGAGFDTFESRGVCPNCGTEYTVARCLDCGEFHSIDEWRGPVPPAG